MSKIMNIVKDTVADLKGIPTENMLIKPELATILHP